MVSEHFWIITSILNTQYIKAIKIVSNIPGCNIITLIKQSETDKRVDWGGVVEFL